MGKEPYTINEWVDVDLFYSNFIHDLCIKGVGAEDSPPYSTQDCVSFFDRGVKGQEAISEERCMQNSLSRKEDQF